MSRIGCLLVVALLLAVPALAAKHLPLWGTVAVVIAEVVLLVVGLPILLRVTVGGLAKRMFEAKSRVLRNARVTVHRIEPIDRPDDEPEDEDDDGRVDDDARWVAIDLTIAPQTPSDDAPFTGWDPDDLALVPYDKDVSLLGLEDARLPDADDADHDEAWLHDWTRLTPDGEPVAEGDDEDDLVAGPQRLRLVFECPSTLTGRVKLRYFFEGLGELLLP